MDLKRYGLRKKGENCKKSLARAINPFEEPNGSLCVNYNRNFCSPKLQCMMKQVDMRGLKIKETDNSHVSF